MLTLKNRQMGSGAFRIPFLLLLLFSLFFSFFFSFLSIEDGGGVGGGGRYRFQFLCAFLQSLFTIISILYDLSSATKTAAVAVAVAAVVVVVHSY